MAELTSVVASIRSIENFVIGGELSAELARSADSDIAAASLALRNMKIALDPKREVTLAVGHLQAAHVKLQKAWRRLLPFGIRNLRTKPFLYSLRLDAWVCCRLAICYLFLREPQLVRQSIRAAQEAMNHDPGYRFGLAKFAEMMGMAAVMMAGWVVFDIGKPWPKEWFEMEDENFDRFCVDVERILRNL